MRNFILLFSCFHSILFAQVLERIVAVVNDHIILESEWREQYKYLLYMGEKDQEHLPCQVLMSMINNYLLLSKAEMDSLEVPDEQVEAEIERRIQLMIQQAGSVEAIEKVYGKPILSLKVELRPKIKEQLLIERARQAIISNVEITPKEVKEYFRKIPKDSLPYIPAEVIIAHIVRYPRPSEENRQRAKQQLEEIRRKILEGKATFAEMARKYSQDLTTAKDGGYLGEFGKGQMVPEFEEVVFQMQPGEISHVFETPYGFHIVQLHKRIGDRVEASHILIKAVITSKEEQETIAWLKQLKKVILEDSLTFAEAAQQYSEDRQTKDNGGWIVSNSGSFRIPLQDLDAELYLAVDQLKEGEISDPIPYIDPLTLRKGFRLVRLIKRYPPHRANLQWDWERFQQAALQTKQMETLQQWLKNARKNLPIEIRDEGCKSYIEQMWQ